MKRTGLSKFSIFIVVAIVAVLSCCGNGKEMVRLLEQAEQQNRDYVPFTSDSIAKVLTEYFDSHGTPNFRMRSHYILGCAYRDLGEAPRALQCLNDAAECADTTSADCDFKTLSRVYGQSFDIMLNQYLLDEALKANALTVHYAMHAKDTLMADISYSRRSFVYSLRHQNDSAIFFREKALDLYSKHGYKEQGILCHEALFPLYLDKGDYEKARKSMDVFESQSNMFDENGNIKQGKEIYYYYKGKYYLAVNRKDSAEHFFRKTLLYADNSNCKEAGNYGLYLLYKSTHMADSAAKYAALAYETNSQRDLEKASVELQHAQLYYNYARYERISFEEREQKHKSQLFNILLIFIILLASIIGYHYIRESRRKRKSFAQRYKQNLKRLVEEQTELLIINESNSREIISEKTRKIEELSNNLASLQQELGSRRERIKNLTNSNIVMQLHKMAINGTTMPNEEQWSELTRHINEISPSFYSIINGGKSILSVRDYRLCMLTFLKFRPAEICNLLEMDPSYVSHLRSRLLLRIFGEEGNGKDFDARIASIR